MEDPGRIVERDEATASTGKTSSFGVSQSACGRPEGDGRNLLRIEDRVPMGRTRRDGDLQALFSAPPLHGMDGGRCLRGILAPRVAGV